MIQPAVHKGALAVLFQDVSAVVVGSLITLHLVSQSESEVAHDSQTTAPVWVCVLERLLAAVKHC